MTIDNPQLIDRCCRKEPKAQLKLYELYAKRLYITCYRIIGNTSEAEEAMQDSFLKIFTRIEQFDREKNFEAWMYRIAVHTAIDYLRQQNPIEEEWDENRSEPENEPESDEEEINYSVSRIRAGIQKLPPGYRLILSLYLFEGYDMEEIASILRIKPVTVRSQYMRGKRKLIELIKE